jgi:hypothetical protein
MQTLRNKLIAMAALGVLAVIGSLMNSRQATAEQGSAPVTVVNTPANPVPVAGSTTVSGSVAATQSGAWNVGITGTPSINIANSPTVQLSGTPTVNVTNPAAAPLYFVNVNDPGRIPYQSQVLQVCSAVVDCTIQFGMVPAGHRLVIQHVSGFLTFTTPPTSVEVIPSAGSAYTPFFAPASQAVGLPGAGISLFDQAVQLYGDGGSNLSLDIRLVGATFYSNSQELTLSGYLLDCTAAPCAAIAH